MAFIQELEKNYTSSIYYLHLYYNKTPNRSVLKKMEDLAQRQHYMGYVYSDLDFFQTQFNKHYLNILQALLMGAVGIGTILFITYRKKRLLPIPIRVLFLFYLLFIAYYINFLRFGRKGIIQENNVAIMSAPSAASTWLATATEGHKIDLKGEQDIWYETEWMGKKAYIRKKNVLELP
ncbi:SH3 domain-containing protein [Adhaeribacter aquaticus]|uniref:SH3 domain-containing protein n=1 Tax=Adhaeribacter aquaticus TaxID=299567 RepID=UPI001FDFE87C|nr:SH3 domain-containing protein [Adhaeribacter aquaticus]